MAATSLLAIFVWPGLLLWAIIVFFMAGRGIPPLNDVTPLPPGRKLLGVVAFVIPALILMSMPDGMSSPRAPDALSLSGSDRISRHVHSGLTQLYLKFTA
jgi:hypothetical protein